MRLTAAYDWSKSPVGPIERWPQSLKNAVSLILQNGMPMYMVWGQELTQFYNDGYIPILGTSKHPIALGKSGKDTWSEIWETIGPMWGKILTTGESFAGNNFKLPIERSGKIIESYFSYSYSPICDDDGKIAGVFVAASELTEDVNLKLQLQAAHEESELSRKKLYNFFMQAPVPMCILEGPRHRYTLVNPPYEAFSGRPVGVGKTLLEVFTLEEVAHFIPLLDDVYKTGNSYVGTHPVRLPDAQGVIQENWINIGYHPYRDLEGNIQGIMVIVQDLTKEVRARQTAEGLTSELQVALLARDEFLSIASHELKTPITALKMQLQMLKRQVKPTEGLMPAPEKLIKALDISTTQIDRMVGLIEDMLDVAKVQAGKMTLRVEPLSLSALFKEIEERFDDQLSAVGSAFRAEAAADIVGTWDKVRLEQVLVNLVSNSIKYAPGASVSLTAAMHSGVVQIAFRDAGPGIPSDRMEAIFNRFERGISSRNISGLGLGLYISRQIVEAHGGTIRVESEFGHGTTFFIELPVKPSVSADRGTGVYSGDATVQKERG